jgi:small subunit ribosomal protein S17
MDQKIKEPEKKCDDTSCPFHGSLKIHGKTYTGKVVKSRMQKTAIVEWTRYRLVPKYERYEKGRTRVKVHNPSCIDAHEGDKVKVMETRPISKTKHFVIIEKA